MTVAGWQAFYAGVLYGPSFHSPDGRFVVRKYRTLTRDSFTSAMPGNGSDLDGGYIRLFYATGPMIEEAFVPFFRDQEPRWADDSVSFAGDDTPVFSLPP